MCCTTCRGCRWQCRKKNLNVEFEVRCLNLRKVAEPHRPSIHSLFVGLLCRAIGKLLGDELCNCCFDGQKQG
jgi:hypothetical protein